MAINPMQRRARNSFLLGMAVTLIIMGIVVVILLNRIKSINDAKEALEALQSEVLVAMEDLESGQNVTIESFNIDTVQTKIDVEQLINSDDFEFKDENGDIIDRIDDNGNPVKREMVMKIAVPAGTIITKDMIVESGEETQDSHRIQEFNMISLPSRLKNGDYIDIRLGISDGQDFIVLSKKKVIGTNANTIWLKLTEEEILALNSAIVESYVCIGSRLYALNYSEPGKQSKAIPTYTPADSTLTLMEKDPNITNKAKTDLANQYKNVNELRAGIINTMPADIATSRDATVAGKNSAETQAILTQRQQFVEALGEDSEQIGYTR